MQSDSESQAMPKVSAIIPAYNAARTIGATLEHAIQQTYRNLEIVVVDDGSSDDTGRIVDTFVARDDRVTHLRKAQGGVAAARNLALANAKGDLIAPLDADDLWHPMKIQRQVAAFLAAPADCGLVYCHARTIDECGRIIGDVACPVPGRNVHPCMINSNFIRCASIPLIRRDLLEQLGGYDPSLRARGAEGAEDFGLYLRLAELSAFAGVDEYLVGYRQTGSNMSNRITQNLNSWHIVLEATRRRHPELPGWLYRWASGNFHRWLGLRAMTGFEPGKGAVLLLRALLEDPGGSLKADLIRATLVTALATGASALGVRRQVRDAMRTLAAKGGSGFVAERQAFLDIDPRQAISMPVPWEVRRMNAVAELPMTASRSWRRASMWRRAPEWLDPRKGDGARAERP